MDQSDKIRFAKIMAGMADNFRDTITKDGMRMRFEMLSTFTIEEVEAAAKHIMATRKYTKMPPIAEFLEAMNGRAPAIEDQALTQANYIVAHLKEFGAGKFPPDLDKTAKHLMTKRWPYYNWGAMVIESELKWWVKEFCEAYRAHASCNTVGGLIGAPEQLRLLADGIGKKV
jgi:hypothetical protein